MDLEEYKAPRQWALASLCIIGFDIGVSTVVLWASFNAVVPDVFAGVEAISFKQALLLRIVVWNLFGFGGFGVIERLEKEAKEAHWVRSFYRMVAGGLAGGGRGGGGGERRMPWLLEEDINGGRVLAVPV